MKNNLKKTIYKGNWVVYLYELIIFAFIILLNCNNILNNPNNKYLLFTLFWIIFLVVLIVKHGIPKNKNMLIGSSIKIVIITFLAYLIITNLLGLIFGFSYSVYAYGMTNILKNVIKTAIPIITIEIVRYILLKQNVNLLQRIILYIELAFAFYIIDCGIFTVRDFKDFFILCSTTILPLLANDLLCTYFSKNVGVEPSVLYKVVVNTFMFVLPIFPRLGNYLISIFGIMVPFVIFMQVKKMLDYNKKKVFRVNKVFKYTINIFLTLILVVLIFLIAGIGKYKIIAIASGSMEPTYYRGDAVIYKKVKAKDIEEGDILVFMNNSSVITHRVVKKYKVDSHYRFVTKGDNNDSLDNEIDEGKVKGVVKIALKYIGYPTVIFNEIIARD